MLGINSKQLKIYMIYFKIVISRHHILAVSQSLTQSVIKGIIVFNVIRPKTLLIYFCIPFAYLPFNVT